MTTDGREYLFQLVELVHTKKTTKVSSQIEPQQQIRRQNKDKKTTTKNDLS